MRRFGRILFNFAAASSLLVVVALSLMGMVFSKREIGPPLFSIGKQVHVFPCWWGCYVSNAQSIDPDFDSIDFSEPMVAGTQSRFIIDPSPTPSIFVTSALGRYSGITWWAAYLNYGVPARVAFVVVVLWAGLFLRRKLLVEQARAAGLCPRCGYDLRASKDACPECGQLIAVTKPLPSSNREETKSASDA